jgi:hypothetical protein
MVPRSIGTGFYRCRFRRQLLSRTFSSAAATTALDLVDLLRSSISLREIDYSANRISTSINEIYLVRRHIFAHSNPGKWVKGIHQRLSFFTGHDAVWPEYITEPMATFVWHCYGEKQAITHDRFNPR